ncbi:cytochrome c3 family protein [Neobacillus drentensis]|uniref:cytochrome c3 family protein n=1 Tax=Neobacillus drentensis TaxID=220684 RepID=UPI002FFD7125
MSKIKFSFSLILTIILVGILSTSVFARGAYWASLSGNKDAYTFKFINTSNDSTKDFAVKVFDGDDFSNLLYTSPIKENVTAVPEPANTTPTNSFVITKDNVVFEDGKIYKFVLYDVTDTSKEIATEIKYAVTTTHDNQSLASVANDPNQLLDVVGSGLTNANHTGQPGTAKKGGNTHGFYQNNTNSCAGCHQTHTAANGEALLFKDGVYSTCSACHDGTTGAYNAFATANDETPNEIAGTFNVKQDTTHNGSLHQSDGSVDVSAAPGGGKSATAIWGNEFNCASCHAPHGSGSTAENNLNMDPLGWGGVEYKALPDGTTLENATDDQKDSLNGKLFKDLEIIDLDANPTALASFIKPYVVAKKTVASTDLSSDKTKEGYMYTRANVQKDQRVIQTYRWTGKAYVRDFSLWLRGSSREAANTVLTGAPATGLTIVWRDGFAFGDAAAVNAVSKATISLGIDVETTTDIKSLFDSTFTNYVFDSGTEMSKYCSACHTDYLSNVRTNKTGTYTQAHRHTTGSDKLTCVRCHFGHGTDATIMKDANDESQFTSVSHNGDLSYFVDPNPSSALKRYTGMSVCYACHGSGGQFISNPNNNHIDPTADDPVYGSHSVGPVAGDALKSGQPGSTRQ